jgi:hypothetical protein
MTVCERRKWGARGRMLKGMKDVLYASQNQVVGGGQRHGGFGWEPRQRVADARCSCFPQPDGVTPVGLESRPDIPAVGAVGRPVGAVGRCDMYEHTDAGGRQRSAIEIECSV